MGLVVLFLLTVLFTAAIWGREAAQKIFKGGVKVALVLLALAAFVVVLLAINLQAPNQTEIQRALDASNKSTYKVPPNIERNPYDAGAALRSASNTDRTDSSISTNTIPTGNYSVASGNRTPKIGVQFQMLNAQNGAAYGLPPGYGLYVLGVLPGSVAEIAGIRPGDYIAQVDGTWITAADAIDRNNNGKRPGDIITLRVLRGGGQYAVRVPLGNP